MKKNKKFIRQKYPITKKFADKWLFTWEKGIKEGIEHVYCNVYPNFYFLNLTAFRQNNIKLGLAASEISTKMPDYSVKAIYHDLPKTVQLVDLGVA